MRCSISGICSSDERSSSRPFWRTTDTWKKEQLNYDEKIVLDRPSDKLPYLRFVRRQLGVETAVLAAEVLHAGQVTAVVIGREQELLLPEGIQSSEIKDHE